MYPESHAKKLQFLTNIACLAAIVLGLWFFSRYLLGWLFPFGVGLGVAVLLRPLVTGLTKKTILSPKMAAVTAVTCFYALAGGLLWLLLWELLSQLGGLFNDLPGLYSQTVEPILRTANQWLISLYDKLSPTAANQLQSVLSSALEQSEQWIAELSQSVLSALGGWFGKLPGALTSFVFAVLSSYFISLDYQTVLHFLMRLTPKGLQPWLFQCKSLLGGSLWKLCKAYLTLMLITFCGLLLGLWLLGVERFLPIAAVTALLDALPLLGIGGILLPWCLIAFAQGRFPFATGLLILYLCLSCLRALLEPKLVGSQTGLPPIAALAALYFGYRLFGFFGMIAAPFLLFLIQELRQKN